jgi:hypothetical protein
LKGGENFSDLGGAAEALPQRILGTEPHGAASRLAVVPRAVQRTPAESAAGLANRGRQIVVEAQQQLKETGILQQVLVQGVVSFRVDNESRRVLRGWRQPLEGFLVWGGGAPYGRR